MEITKRRTYFVKWKADYSQSKNDMHNVPKRMDSTVLWLPLENEDTKHGLHEAQSQEDDTTDLH
jgi:hypothetical protein